MTQPPRKAVYDFSPLYWAAGSFLAVLVLAAAVAFWLWSTRTPPTPNVVPEGGFASIVSCSSSTPGFQTVKVRVVNSAKTTQTYTVTVVFRGERYSRVGSATVVVRDLAAGDSAIEEAVGSVSSTASVCELGEVRRG